MGRKFLLRSLEKRVNGENQFPRIDSLSIKHTHWECRLPARQLRKKEGVMASAASLIVSFPHENTLVREKNTAIRLAPGCLAACAFWVRRA